MPESSPRTRLLSTAACGLAGALLLFAGDMLLYGHFGSGSDFAVRYKLVIASASNLRLHAAGALGPVAALAYLAGALHVYLRLAPARRLLRLFTSLSFVATFVIAGSVHAVWGVHALTMRALHAGQASPQLGADVHDYLGLLYRMAEIAGYPAALSLLALVLAGETSYPRWSALFNPGLLMLLEPATSLLPGPLGAPVAGGLFNLSFCAFFVVSLATVPRGDA